MSHQHEIAWFRLWRFPRCIFRCWMAGRGLVKQRDVLAHPDRLEANVFGTPAEVADHFWRRQERQECGERADLHSLTLCVGRQV